MDIQVRDKKSKIYIEILNVGKHIPQDVQNRLFEPFFTTKSNGTGLGLATTKRLMQEMNSDIELENKDKSHILTILTLKKRL